MTADNSWRLEQHIGTVLQALVIALLGWSLKTTVDLRAEIGVIQAKLEAVQATMAQGTNDRYRGSDAARDFSAVWAEFQRREVRLSRLEDEVAALKRGGK
jgi:hypothetical protein